MRQARHLFSQILGIVHRDRRGHALDVHALSKHSRDGGVLLRIVRVQHNAVDAKLLVQPAAAARFYRGVFIGGIL
jgi:hypothetical protein